MPEDLLSSAGMESYAFEINRTDSQKTLSWTSLTIG
jgi:hypothetical protein